MKSFSIQIASVLCLISLCGHAQKPIKKYNEQLKMTEYYDADGVMVGFSRVNKKRQTIEHYDMTGRRLRSEPITSDSIKSQLVKSSYPKSQLTQKELKAVKEWQVKEVDGRHLIQGSKPDLQIIGFYDFTGKLVAINKYHRGTEEWFFQWLEEIEEDVKRND